VSPRDVAERHASPSRDEILVRLANVVSPGLLPAFGEGFVQFGEVSECKDGRGRRNLGHSCCARNPLCVSPQSNCGLARIDCNAI
jgi:hypothetical protein